MACYKEQATICQSPVSAHRYLPWFSPRPNLKRQTTQLYSHPAGKVCAKSGANSPPKKTILVWVHTGFFCAISWCSPKNHSLTPPSSVENYYKVIFWGVPCPIESQTVSLVKSTFSKHSGYHLQTYNLQFLTHLRYLFLKALIIYLLNA